MSGRSYAIINDEVVETTGQPVPLVKGLEYIKGKAEPGDRQKYNMKVDPSLVREFIKGKESDLGRTPIMVYDYSEPRWARKIDLWTANVACFLLGAALTGSLYYWRVLNFFAK